MFEIAQVENTQVVTLGWYHISQNNSGGYYSDPAQNVWIQAATPEQAESTFEAQGYDTNYCECCGERWWVMLSDRDRTDFPEWYGDRLDELTEKPWQIDREGVPFGLLIFANGTEQILNVED